MSDISAAMLSDDELRELVRWRLATLERSPIDAAVKGGLERNYIRDWLTGKKASIKRSNYDKVAAGLDWEEADLLGPSVPATVRVVGYVGAGAEAHFYSLAEESDYDALSAPPGATASTVAVQIRGTSLGPSFDRWYACYDDVRRPPGTDLIGRLCVVGLATGQILVKKLQVGARRGRFNLVSENAETIRDAEVEWAARVTTMMQPP